MRATKQQEDSMVKAIVVIVTLSILAALIVPLATELIEWYFTFVGKLFRVGP